MALRVVTNFYPSEEVPPERLETNQDEYCNKHDLRSPKQCFEAIGLTHRLLY